MRVAYVRHGERRKGESDPELTSFGVRMVDETARWLRDQNFVPTLVQTTSTRRTQQTASLLTIESSEVTMEIIEEAPELRVDWERWWQELSNRRDAPENVLLVGHHPTMEMLLQCYGPAPCSISRRNFAVALVLRTDSDGRYTITQAWPGRLSLA